ncbi:MAG: DUF4190 domain-containing protein [Nanoarchaeota archaeon]|nr:DUF4190 domain-containing protein [Nanoarchaeota archaeon]
MVKKDTATISYIFGIISIVLAFFTPVAGLIFGVIGLKQSKKEKDELSKRAKKYSTIGIVLSVIMILISLAVTVYTLINGLSPIGDFPI